MTPGDIAAHVERLQQRASELENKLADPAIYQKSAELKSVSQEHRKLKGLFENFRRWQKALEEISENELLLSEENDEDLLELAQGDLESLRSECADLENKVRQALLPPDENDSRNIIVEIRPAAGGDEAALFAGELCRAYMRYAESKGWKVELLEENSSELGGIKNVSFSLSGDDVYMHMKFESGVHRVQRVPVTEAAGRVHTSTVTVAIMPEAEAVEINIRPEDLRFDVFRSSGPGGQSVNTTDSAVRVTYLPTGLSVASQQEKSQHRNKEIALRILYARLLEARQAEEAAKQSADKQSQIGTGDRSERIRTYNFPQNRVTDHRYNVSSFDLPSIMEGEFERVIDPIMAIDSEMRFEELQK
ncbi:MAG: peptide chain release factor 1 [Lentisphaerae bacterium]|nr:peptide chain release factor 1 [Lentisphaerota bacterium]